MTTPPTPPTPSFSSPRPLDQLLRDIVSRAQLPLERAIPLPGEAYVNPELYQLEVNQIFKREWMCVGRTDELPQRGDYLMVDFVGEPIAIVRGDDGELRALSRLCRHRFADIWRDEPHPSGSVSKLECPYHTWTYGLDGTLKGAPFTNDLEDFDRAACSLPTLQLETWQGFIFVNLDPEAEPLAPRMKGIESILGNYNFADWKTVGGFDWGETRVNWKIVVENYSECYHHIGVHKDILQPLWPAAMVETDTNRSSEWFYQRLFAGPKAATEVEDGRPLQPLFFPPAPGLSAFERSHTLLLALFPMFLIAPGPDMIIWLKAFPTGPETHKLEFKVVVPPETPKMAGFEGALQEAIGFLREIQTQDAGINSAIQAHIGSGFTRGGRLTHFERPLWQLQKFLAVRLADAVVD